MAQIVNANEADPSDDSFLELTKLVEVAKFIKYIDVNNIEKQLDLNKLTLDQLRELAKNAGIKGVMLANEFDDRSPLQIERSGFSSRKTLDKNGHTR